VTDDDVSGLIDAGMPAIAAALRAGTTTAVALAEAVLARIEARNGGLPTFDGAPDALNAWEHLDPRTTLEQAHAADRRIAEGDPSILLGIPIGVKALYAVAGQPQTASSRMLDGHVSRVDSAAWAALSAAGAVYAGHTHTHEFAAGGTTDQVGNPWKLALSPGGSSGGSAAAVAAGMVPLALGTDTAGSLRVPAAFCGVSSFKPSFGRSPMDGVLPLSATLDHSGPIARTLLDCAIAFAVLSAAPRPAEPFGVGRRAGVPVPEPADLRGRRIALTDRPDLVDLDVEPDILDGLAAARAALEELGAEIVELPSVAGLGLDEYDTILIAEARHAHARWADRAAGYRPSTREFIAHGAESMPVDVYLDTQARRIEVTARWEAWFSAHRIDAILEPTTAIGARARGHGYDAGRPIGGTDPLTCFTATWNVTGSPVAALPAGLGARTGLPVGVSLIGPGDADADVLAIGIALQALLPPPISR
jgi:aspartyl-tRNA(Asn)/glutamyl-tRNA(Gln) amidotransferase subunit A